MFRCKYSRSVHFSSDVFSWSILKSIWYQILRKGLQDCWMNSGCFLHVIRLLIKHNANSIENPSLLVMDNYESHQFLKRLTLCKENGITKLIVLPHCTHKLQLLDASLMKQFHTFYLKTCRREVVTLFPRQIILRNLKK